jgi:GT2 family glycosyltransferase
MKRELLVDAGGFDERFPFAAVEDVELGMRLDRRGVTLEYHPELLVHHDHPTDFAAAVTRMERTGASAALLHDLRPQEGNLFPGARTRWRLYPAAALTARALLATRPPRRLRERAWAVLMLDAYARGYRRGTPEIVRSRG